MHSSAFRGSWRAMVLLPMLSACAPSPLQSPMEDTPPASTEVRLRARSSLRLLQDPAVGDLYAAELTHFSEGDFNRSGKEPMYGLMKVIRVGPATITVVTEQDAWPDRRDAIIDLHKHAGEAVWDMDEQVTLPRSVLLQLGNQRHILDALRSDEATQATLTAES